MSEARIHFDPWGKEPEGEEPPPEPPHDEGPPIERVVPYAFTAGGDFILDASTDPEPLWGAGQEVLLADGEALIIAGSQGLGKTTIAQQLALGRCGLPGYDNLLGWPITPGAGRVLYLAMDRPRQAARSFRRMVTADWRDTLNDRLVVWQGPPVADLAQRHGLLLDYCRKADADTVIVDSLKDAAVGLIDDTVGAGYNRARQTAISDGVQVIELHHNRKTIGGAKGPSTPTLDDLYGSTWLPAGAGSVVLLTGAPGDSIVQLHHLKQPSEQVGPLRLIHDHDTGRTTLFHSIDLLRLAAASPSGLTSVDAARALFETDTPDNNQREKARRRLEKHTTAGHMHRKDGNQSAGIPHRYFRITRTGT